MKIAWILPGSIDARTGGTIYDRAIIQGLGRVEGQGAVEVHCPDDPAALLRRLARTRPDVVVGDELAHRELAFLFPRIEFARRVLLVHHPTCWETELHAPARARARRTEAIALRHADLVIATSNTTRLRLIAEGARDPVVVLPGADRLAKVAVPRVPGRYLFVGALIPRKRVHEVVDLFPGLRVVGPTPDARYSRSLEGRITLVGEVDEPTLAREICAAEALVMPSSLEGYGIAATEAAHLGVPVLATRGLAEALGPAGEGALVVDDLREFRRADLPRMRAALAHARFPTWAEAVSDFASALGVCSRDSTRA